MSRFGRLEFNHESEGETHERLVKDEAYHLGEARAAFEQAEFERSLRAYAKVLEFNPKNAPAWTGQVRALIELGEYHEAKVWADKALEHFPNEAELLAAKAVALGRSGDLDGALAFSDASMQERGDSPYLWLARGDVMLARAEKRADYCFDKAFALAPRDWFVAWLAARIRYFYQQFVLALRLVQPAVQSNPDQAALWLQLGLCQKELGMIAPARISFTQARQLNPRLPEPARALAQLSQAGLGLQWRGLWKLLFGR